MTAAVFFLILLGALLAIFGFLAQGNVPIIALGLLAIFGAGLLEVLGRRRS